MIDITGLREDKRPQSSTIVHALLDRLEAAEKELAELRSSMKFRTSLIGRTEAERDTLRAKIAEMEQQEPYSYIYEYANPIDGSPVWRDTPGYWNAQFPRSSKPLYALPGAQPAPSLASGDVSLISEGKTQQAPSVPHGWKLVPIEPTEEMMMRDSSCQKHAHDDQSCVHRTNRRWIWKTMLAAAPEAKPCP